jgi:ABC-type glycerol-3-phosphate transport system substrate-binding protein
MKIKNISIFLFFLLGVIFFGCKNNVESETNIKSIKSEPIKKIKIKWLAQWYGEGKKELLIREIAREFSLLHQNIEIEIEFPHQMAKIEPLISTTRYVIDTIAKMALQNEWTYDIMLCDAGLYAKVRDKIQNKNWGKEMLVDFKENAWFIDAHKKNFFDTKSYTSMYGGIIPGAYIDGMWNILYVSSSVENRLGIKVKKYDMNMSDFTFYAKSVYEYNKSHSDKITFAVFPWTYINQFFSHITMSALEKDSISNKEEGLNALKQAYQALENLAPYKPLDRNVVLKNERTLSSDKVLFDFYPSWINLIWQKNNPTGEKMMHPCELPSIDGKRAKFYSGTYSSVFVIPKNAKNREAAELLMKFISSQQTAEKWVKYSRSPTGLENRISYNDFGADEYTKFSKHIKQKYNDKLNEVNIASSFLNSSKTLDYQAGKVMNGEISADDALKSLIKQSKMK